LKYVSRSYWQRKKRENTSGLKMWWQWQLETVILHGSRSTVTQTVDNMWGMKQRNCKVMFGNLGEER